MRSDDGHPVIDGHIQLDGAPPLPALTTAALASPPYHPACGRAATNSVSDNLIAQLGFAPPQALEVFFDEILAVSNGDLEEHAYHAIELLHSVVERRRR